MPLLRKKGIEFATAGGLPPDRDVECFGDVALTIRKVEIPYV